jgi:addiction module antidote protein, HigA family
MLTIITRKTFNLYRNLQMTKEMIIHPWEFVADELEARGWTQKYFAEIIQKSPAEVNHLITGRRNLNADWAMRIAVAFGTSPELWIRLQNKYDFQMLENSQEEQALFKLIEKSVQQELTFA